MSQNSIGIIGGQDGPTAILVSGDPVLPILIAVIAVVLVIIVIVLLIHARK